MAFLKTIWKTNTKHKKLSEELALQGVTETDSDQPEQENDVLTFKLKYLGATVVEKLSTLNVNAECVKDILKANKTARKNAQRVNLTISLKGIVVTDLEGNDLFKVSIYRISNCSTDPEHRQVFSFLSTDSMETTECHAFICSKRKQAETVTLAIANAFGTAYEAWRILPSTKEFENAKNTDNDKNFIEESTQIEKNRDEQLIVFDDEPSINRSCKFENDFKNFKNDWVCFDDDFPNQLYFHNANKVDVMA